MNSSLRQFVAIVALAAPVCLLASEPTAADFAERGDAAGLSKALSDGADVDAAQPDGTTALHWAVYRDDVALTKSLLDAGADAKALNRYGVGPLAIACTNGNEKIVELLLDAGADPTQPLRGGETPLMTASRTGKLGPVKALLARGAKVDAKENGGQTALMWAAAEGHVDVVKELLAAGADHRQALSTGFTPLLFAAREGQTAVVKALLDAGADVEQATTKKPYGRSPAVGTSALILAIENGHFETAIVLLDAGADPNDQRSGYAPLHVLSWVRKPNMGDGIDGEPAPRGSGELSSLEFVDELVERGADVNARLAKGSAGGATLGHKGATPFLLASATTDLPYMRKLVELGADPHVANEAKTTPLVAAAGVGIPAPQEAGGTEAETIAALEYLLDLGCDIDAVDANGDTAMHGAAYKMYPRVVALLAKRGADPDVWNRKNRFGWAPGTIASGRRHGNFRPSPETAAALKAALGEEGDDANASAPGRSVEEAKE